MVNRLFVYGTLAPGRANAHILAGLAGTWEPATARGALYQEGWGAALGYPGFVPAEDGEVVHGLVFSSDALPQHWARLDAFEGAGYERVPTTATLRSGAVVSAYVYRIVGHAPAR